MTSANVRRALLLSLSAALLVIGALQLGGGLVRTATAKTGCLSDPDTPTCVVPPMLPNLSSEEKTQVEAGTAIAIGRWTPLQGLGPVYTQDDCVDCHFTPVAEGSGNGGTTNTVVHFGKLNRDGSFNPLTGEGGDQVQPNSIAGDVFVPKSCALKGEVVPADATIIVSRATPPTFGDGLIDGIPDSTIQANVTNQANSSTDQRLGIHGQVNMGTDVDGKTPRVGRFGWKDQQPTLLQFIAGAMHNEFGVTDPLNPAKNLPQGQFIPANCVPTGKHFPNCTTEDDCQEILTIHLSNFIRFTAPHNPMPFSPDAQAGQQLFNQIGCAICHMPSMQTASQVFFPNNQLNPDGTINGTFGPSNALSNQTANLYSDLLIHDMGPILADGFPQRHAQGSQWRTTPLWGLSLKVIYLHDGRTTDLTTAILDHQGEAALVMEAFQQLSAKQQQQILDFLSAL